MMEKYSLSKEFEIRGKFWLPDQPDEQVTGTLRYRPGSIELELLGRLNKPVLPDRPEEEGVHALILGSAITGEHLSLFENWSFNDRLTTYGISTQSYNSIKLFIGAIHVTNVESQLFAQSQLSPVGLEDWLASRPFEIKDPREDGLNGITAIFRAPAAQTWQVPSRGFVLETSYEATLGGNSWCSLNWDFLPCLRITPETPKKLEWFMLQVRFALNFLTLVLGNSVEHREVSLCITDGESKKWVTVLWAGTIKKTTIGRRSHPSFFLAPFYKIGENLPKTLDAFYTAADRYRLAYDTFFAFFSGHESYVDTYFLAFVQALEQHHRISEPVKYIPEQDYMRVVEKLIQAIPEDIPSEARQVLGLKLQYLNEISLQSRLNRILKAIDPEIRGQLFPDGKRFGNIISGLRNGLIHGPNDPANYRSDNEALHYRAIQIEILLLIRILEDAKIPATIYKAPLLSRYRYLKEALGNVRT